MVIIAGLALIVLLVFMGTKNGGYTISYDSRGGSDVAQQTVQFQDPLEPAAAPARDGYTFTGWYIDENCTIPAKPGAPVENSMELYAGWKPSDQ